MLILKALSDYNGIDNCKNTRNREVFYMETGRLSIDHNEFEDAGQSSYNQNDYENRNYRIDDEFSDDTQKNYIVLDDPDDRVSSIETVSESDTTTSTSPIPDPILNDEGITDQDNYANNYDDTSVIIEEVTEKVIPESSDIIGGSYRRETYKPSNPRKLNDESLKNVTVSTQHVARVLNVTEQTIRNYCRDFSDFLNIETTGAGRMRFTNDDIEHIRYIMRLKDENNFTLEQLKEYLSSPDNYSRLPERERLDNFASQLEKQVLELISKKLSTTTALLEESSRAREEDRKQMQELVEAFHHQSDELHELKENMKKIDTISSTIDKVNDNLSVPKEILADYQSKIELLEKENERLMIDNANKDKLVHEHEQTISELNAAKKKKKFFGLI